MNRKRVYVPEGLFPCFRALYPSHRLLTEIPPVYVPKVLFLVASPGEIRTDLLDGYLSSSCSEWVVVTTHKQVSVDVDLIERTALMDLAETIRRVRHSKQAHKKAERLTEKEFCRFFLRSLAARRWVKEDFLVKENVFALFAALPDGVADILHAYFEVTKHMTPGEVFTSLVTFFLKTLSDEDDDSMSSIYRRVLKRGRSKGFLLRESLARTARATDLPEDAKFLSFVMGLRR